MLSIYLSCHYHYKLDSMNHYNVVRIYDRWAGIDTKSVKLTGVMYIVVMVLLSLGTGYPAHRKSGELTKESIYTPSQCTTTFHQIYYLYFSNFLIDFAASFLIQLSLLSRNGLRYSRSLSSLKYPRAMTT